MSSRRKSPQGKKSRSGPERFWQNEPCCDFPEGLVDMLKGQVKDPVVATQLLFINSHGVPLENEVQDYLQGREVNESTRRGVEVQALLEGLSNLACPWLKAVHLSFATGPLRTVSEASIDTRYLDPESAEVGPALKTTEAASWYGRNVGSFILENTPAHIITGAIQNPDGTLVDIDLSEVRVAIRGHAEATESCAKWVEGGGDPKQRYMAG